MYKALNYWVFGGFDGQKTPYEFIDWAAEQGLDGVELTIGDCLKDDITKEECEKMGMGAFLAVGRGSSEEPKFIHMKYTCENPKKKIAIVGKGITFDSGGLDIKPASSMLTMKDDMSGAACVLGVARLISSAKIIFEKIGPFWKVNFIFPVSSFSMTLVPVTSLGIKSGVN